MDFPDMPFDEKLFESNELLRSYWDRATESRPEPIIGDGYLESEELDDLRSMTHEAFADESALINANFGSKKSPFVFAKSTDGATAPTAEPSAEPTTAPTVPTEPTAAPAAAVQDVPTVPEVTEVPVVPDAAVAAPVFPLHEPAPERIRRSKAGLVQAGAPGAESEDTKYVYVGFIALVAATYFLYRRR